MQSPGTHNAISGAPTPTMPRSRILEKMHLKNNAELMQHVLANICSTALQQSDKHRQHNERLADVPARPAVVRFAKAQGGSLAMKVLVVDADPRRHRPVRVR
jgi:hypothetical protein